MILYVIIYLRRTIQNNSRNKPKDSPVNIKGRHIGLPLQIYIIETFEKMSHVIYETFDLILFLSFLRKQESSFKINFYEWIVGSSPTMTFFQRSHTHINL